MGGNAKNKILSNSFWMIVQHLYSMITSLTVVALIARHLGPSDYGLINYCASVITIFTTLSGLGLDNVIVSEIIRKPEREGGYLGTALALRLVASLISYPLLLALVWMINPGDKILLIVAALQAASMVFQTYNALVYWFQIKLKMKYISIAMICAITVTSVLRIVLLTKKASVGWFSLSISVQAFVAAVVVTAFFLKQADVRLKVSVADARDILKLSYNFIFGIHCIHLFFFIINFTNQTLKSFFTTYATHWDCKR